MLQAVTEQNQELQAKKEERQQIIDEMAQFKLDNTYTLTDINGKTESIWNDTDASKTYDEMRETYQSLSDRNDLEVIFVRAAGSDADIPYGLHFLGYDVCYPPGGDGFSAICDCMFLCRWHGCDEAGTEFTDDFMRLNENGLFDSKQEAEIYLRHYAIQDWAETGDFCILEIYK